MRGLARTATGRRPIEARDHGDRTRARRLAEERLRTDGAGIHRPCQAQASSETDVRRATTLDRPPGWSRYAVVAHLDTSDLSSHRHRTSEPDPSVRAQRSPETKELRAQRTDRAVTSFER
jgi:hypothetical protein